MITNNVFRSVFLRLKKPRDFIYKMKTNDNSHVKVTKSEYMQRLIYKSFQNIKN